MWRGRNGRRPSGETSRLSSGFFDQQLAVTRQEEEGLKENLDRVKRAVELGYMTGLTWRQGCSPTKMHTSVLTTEQQREEERLALINHLGFG